MPTKLDKRTRTLLPSSGRSKSGATAPTAGAFVSRAAIFLVPETETTTRFRTQKPELYKVLHAALKEAMEIIAADKGRAVDGYINATGDKKTAREMLLKIANDPDVEFTMTPRAMKFYAEFMYRNGAIKRLPDTWSELFFPETASLNGS